MGILSSFNIFASFSSAELTKLEALCQPRRLDAGETLFHEGDSATAFYLIASWELEILRTRAGEPRRITLLGEGETVGEMAFFDRLGNHGTRNATARATVATELVVILADALDMLGSSEPAIVRALERIIRERKIRESRQEE